MRNSLSIKKESIGVGGLVLSPLAKKYVNDVLNRNRLSYGHYSKRFESEFAKAHGVAYACFVNSGTDALRIGLAAMKEYYGWRDGDEVIVPAVTFVATSNIVIQNQMTPVFVDVDPRTYNIDHHKIAASLTKRTRTIIPVHLMGLPCDMEPIIELAVRHNLKVIEDSCEAMFASYKGKKVGSFGDVAAFSTYIAHFLVTGVGGLATTNNRELALMIRSLMNHGRDHAYLSIDDDNDVDFDELLNIVKKRFHFVRLGYSSRCTEMEAAIGLAQLEESDAIINSRKQIASKFNEQLSDLADHIQLPYEPSETTHSYMLYPLVLRNEAKDGLVCHLEKNNIETRDLMPLLSQPVYKKLFGELEEKFPIAQWLNRCGLYIGCHSYLTPDEQDYVIEKIHEYFKA